MGGDGAIEPSVVFLGGGGVAVGGVGGEGRGFCCFWFRPGFKRFPGLDSQTRRLRIQAYSTQRHQRKAPVDFLLS